MIVYKLTDENMQTYGGCQWKIGERMGVASISSGTSPLVSLFGARGVSLTSQAGPITRSMTFLRITYSPLSAMSSSWRKGPFDACD